MSLDHGRDANPVSLLNDRIVLVVLDECNQCHSLTATSEPEFD
jgi:hypothetical protein